MAITLVINNAEDLASAISKAILFSAGTFILIVCALISAVFVASQSELEEFNDVLVVPYILLTTPFLLHGFQLLITMVILQSARMSTQNMSMAKCRLWSLLSRILTAPILIEMMILIGFKWYLTFIAIPLVMMYFVTMLQVEKIIHHFFTRSLFERNRPTGLLMLNYPYNVDINSSFHLLATRAATSHARENISTLNLPPPTYNEAVAGSAGDVLTSGINVGDESPPPPYHDAIKIKSSLSDA